MTSVKIGSLYAFNTKRFNYPTALWVRLENSLDRTIHKLALVKPAWGVWDKIDTSAPILEGVVDYVKPTRMRERVS